MKNSNRNSFSFLLNGEEKIYTHFTILVNDAPQSYFVEHNAVGRRSFTKKGRFTAQAYRRPARLSNQDYVLTDDQALIDSGKPHEYHGGAESLLDSIKLRFNLV